METEEVALDILSVAIHGAVGFAIGLVVSIIVSLVVRFLMRKRPSLEYVSNRLRAPKRLFLLLLGTGTGLLVGTASAAPAWRPVFSQAFLIVMIFAGAYLVTGALRAVEDILIARDESARETPHARRLRTQSQVVTRVMIAVVWMCAIAGALLTFPEFRAIGASMFASAGVLSIVAGLAAQSSLSNMFAGMQIAFSDSLRVGDLVVVEGEMGHVEEITLTYVVVNTWDDRRWIVPSSVFTTKAFENWTKREAKLLGTVELDVDWLIPVQAMRIHLSNILQRSELWDRRSSSLQVTDATGGHVTVRAVVSAASYADLWDLRCHVREELIDWVQAHAIYSLPRTRLEPETTTAPSQEEREAFTAQALEEWERQQAEAQSAQETALLPPLPGSPVMMQRSWFRALRDQKTASAGVTRPALPPEDTDPNLTIADARLFSGSPEAEERSRQFAGPSEADMAQREKRARKRTKGR